MRDTIGGVLDLDALRTLASDDPAQAHAPRDRAETRRACVDLLSRGYSTGDVAAALRLSKSGVLALLAEAVPGAKRHG